MPDNPVIFVEFDDNDANNNGNNGMRMGQVARGLSLADKSREAVENSLESIKWVGEQLHTVLDGMTDQPDTVELEFGIKVSTEAGVIVKGTADFHIKAKLVWKKDPPADGASKDGN
ncbi:MAG: CU044_2847 family protein [Chloroflexota bacterium]